MVLCARILVEREELHGEKEDFMTAPLPKPEPITPEQLEQMIQELSDHLQQVVRLADSIWATLRFKDRSLAATIENPDEFVLISKAAEKLREVSDDIYSMSATGRSWTDPIPTE